MVVPSIAQAQSTLPFTDILFVERGILGGSETDGFHFCDEYYGHNGRKGGGLFILKNFQTSPQKVDVVAGLTVPSGKTNAGQTLSSGTFLSPDLSYDGKTIVFAWSSGGTEKWQAKNRFHVFKVDIDGKNLVQLTDGNFDDMHPAWMPSGRIVFNSTRRGGYGRCHGRPVPTYALHSMKSDGSDLIRLSYHETNEFHPSIANDGRIVYMRWDYIDRDALAAHHIWFCNPDGSNPRSWGGNYSNPLDTMTGSNWSDGRKDGHRPQSEFYPRAIPGSATKYVAVAGPHHGEAFGTLIMRDFSKVDDNQMGQVTKLTPDVGMPETAENGSLTYGPAWPLSETQFLTSYNNTIVLYDSSAKKRTEYYKTSDSNLRPIYVIPVQARTKPPVIVESTYQGERWCPTAPPATIQVQNVNVTDSYGKLPSGMKVTSMRIVQVLPKTTPNANDPRLGYASQNVAKMVLGTVPVESDGSVFFEAPIGKGILFHLLDDKGMAIQTMRSLTYLHPGENMTCVGCHEDKLAAPPTGGTPIASTRPASKMEPELGRVEPINYARYIKPILTKCYSCHTGTQPTDTSYGAQQNFAFWFAGDANGNLEAVHGGSRSKPGMVGARNSRMGKALLNTTHQQAQAAGKYTETDFRTLVQWLDMGSDELGSFDNQNGQRQGQVVWPTLDVDKNDPQGLKYTPEGPSSSTCSGNGGSTGGGTGGGMGGSTAPAGTGGATGNGGKTGAGGAVASGGQSGSQTTPTGGAGGAASGGQSGGGGSRGMGGTTGSGGQAGSASGGQGGSASGGRGGSASGGQAGSANGGQAGSGNGGQAGSGNGGQAGSGNGGQPGSGGAGGKSAGSGGKAGLSSAGGNPSLMGCSIGANRRSVPAHGWVLFVIGLALLVRNRRKT